VLDNHRVGRLESPSDFTHTKPIGKAIEHCIFMRAEMRREQGNNIPHTRLAYNRVAWVHQFREFLGLLEIVLEM